MSLRPSFMNAQKVDDPAEIFARPERKKILFVVKYDGVRLQIHLREDGRDTQVCFSPVIDVDFQDIQRTAR